MIGRRGGVLWNGREVRSRTEYILGTDRRLFRNFAVQDPRHNSDHYMVLGCLPRAPLTDHKRYLGGRKRWPVRPPVKTERGQTNFSRLYGDPYQRCNRSRQDETPGSRRRRGDSSTREYSPPLVHPPFNVLRQDILHLLPNSPCERLPVLWVLACGDSLVDEYPRFL